LDYHGDLRKKLNLQEEKECKIHVWSENEPNGYVCGDGGGQNPKKERKQGELTRGGVYEGRFE